MAADTSLIYEVDHSKMIDDNADSYSILSIDRMRFSRDMWKWFPSPKWEIKQSKWYFPALKDFFPMN